MISSNDIRRDVALCEGGLTEKFVKAGDPTVVIGKFLEDAGKLMSSVQNIYNKNARDRNQAVAPVSKILDQIINLAELARDDMADSKSDPEDTNTSIGNGK